MFTHDIVAALKKHTFPTFPIKSPWLVDDFWWDRSRSARKIITSKAVESVETFGESAIWSRLQFDFFSLQAEHVPSAHVLRLSKMPSQWFMCCPQDLSTQEGQIGWVTADLFYMKTCLQICKDINNSDNICLKSRNSPWDPLRTLFLNLKLFISSKVMNHRVFIPGMKMHETL